MPDFRRYFVPGGTFFFTLVTSGRRPLFRSAAARALLGRAMRHRRMASPFETVAIVLLHDHLHVIWTLPPGDADYSGRWRAIKAEFTSAWLECGGGENEISPGYQRQRRRGVWQPRYMEHTIRDERDLLQHADYIHYNPVKHGHARRPWDWRWSSFRRYVSSGDYPENWAADGPPPSCEQIDTALLE